MNDKCLILCVDGATKWKAVQDENKLDCSSKKRILRMKLVGRKVLFFDRNTHNFVGEAKIADVLPRDVISFKDLQANVYPKLNELLKSGINFNFAKDREHKKLCSGILFSKDDCEKILPKREI